jgi:type II secretory pathway pseudopilin PulG
MKQNRGFTYVELLLSISFFALFMFSFVGLFSYVVEDYKEVNSSYDQRKTLLFIESMIKKDYKEHKIVSLQDLSGLVMTKENGEQISYTQGVGSIVYESPTVKKTFPNASIVYDPIEKKITLSYGAETIVFVLAK